MATVICRTRAKPAQRRSNRKNKAQAAGLTASARTTLSVRSPCVTAPGRLRLRVLRRRAKVAQRRKGSTGERRGRGCRLCQAAGPGAATAADKRGASAGALAMSTSASNCGSISVALKRRFDQPRSARLRAPCNSIISLAHDGVAGRPPLATGEPLSLSRLYQRLNQLKRHTSSVEIISVAFCELSAIPAGTTRPPPAVPVIGTLAALYCE